MSVKLKRIIFALVLALSLTGAFAAGCGISVSSLPGTQTGQSVDIPDSELGREVFDEAWDIVLQKYVERDKIDTDKLYQAAVRGMLEALDDPYTEYIPAHAYELSLSDFEGKFEGIGAYIGIKDDRPIIIAPVKDSPADQAGIKPGDRILEIDGEPATEMSIDEIVLHVRGPKGTPVRLLVQHEGAEEPELIEIIRDEIKLSSVYSEMMDGIAYIRIHSFTERTNEELGDAIDEVEAENAEGIVLDLRSNPGGLLDSVVDVAGRFIKSGVVLYVRDNQGNIRTYNARPSGAFTDLPIVALTDNYTASAAEVLTGALQDHDRATIAGTTTFGKGSVNTLYDLKDGSGLKITSARWLTPNERLIEGEGIDPDYVLDPEEDAVQWAIDFLKKQ